MSGDENKEKKDQTDQDQADEQEQPEAAEAEAKEPVAEAEEPAAEAEEPAAEAEEPAAEAEEPAAEAEEPASEAEEPAARAEEPAAGDKPATEAKPAAESGEADDEMDEGWPRSWIITTAILGIVAIIIIARLVGQSWRKDVPQDHRPEGIAPPPGEHVDKAPGKAPGKAPAVRIKKLLQASGLSVAPGSFCLGQDRKLHAYSDKARPDSCKVALEDNSSYRLEIRREEGGGEGMLQLVPAAPVMPFVLNMVIMPHPNQRSWIGGSIGRIGRPEVMMVINNPGKEPLKLHAAEMTVSPHSSRPPGKVVSRLELKELALPGGGEACVGKDRKAHKLAAGDKLPEICLLSVDKATVYRMEFKRVLPDQELHISLRPAEQDAPRLVEGQLVPHPEPDGPADIVEGSLRQVKKVAVVLNTMAKEGIKLKYFLFVAKAK